MAYKTIVTESAVIRVSPDGTRFFANGDAVGDYPAPGAVQAQWRAATAALDAAYAADALSYAAYAAAFADTVDRFQRAYAAAVAIYAAA